jgi:hypothetical protein
MPHMRAVADASQRPAPARLGNTQIDPVRLQLRARADLR